MSEPHKDLKETVIVAACGIRSLPEDELLLTLEKLYLDGFSKALELVKSGAVI